VVLSLVRTSGLAPVMRICDFHCMSKRATEDHRPRRSASAESALRAEIARLSRMTVEERITNALTMRKRFAWIQSEEPSSRANEK
jgi:hypothetical protein